MTLADTNLWLAISLSKHVFHVPARDWLAAQLKAAPVLFCRSTQQSFLRLLTTDATMRPYGLPPMTNADAWKHYESIVLNPRVSWAAEPDSENLTARWKAFAARGATSPKLWMDAYLAAFAVTGGYQLVTTDKAFTQFKGLNPIVLTPQP